MTKVINLRKRKKFTHEKFHKPRLDNIKLSTDIYYIAFTLMSIFSLLSGCLIYKSESFDYCNLICKETLEIICSSEFTKIFIMFFKSELIYFLLTFFIGTSLIGMPMCIIPVLIKCVMIGYFSSYMYCEYELKGILFCLVLIYPVAIITTASMIYAASESVYMSKYIYRAVIKKNTADNMSVRLYLIRYSILLLVNIVCIAISTILINFLINKFNLL